MGAIVSVYVLSRRVDFVATIQTRIDLRRFPRSGMSITQKGNKPVTMLQRSGWRGGCPASVRYQCLGLEAQTTSYELSLEARTGDDSLAAMAATPG
jgi:hypothetical protein